MNEDKLTIHKAALFLNVCKTTLRSWHKKGKLVPEVHPLTKARYYKKEDLEKFLEDNRNNN